MECLEWMNEMTTGKRLDCGHLREKYVIFPLPRSNRAIAGIPVAPARFQRLWLLDGDAVNYYGCMYPSF